MDSRSTALYTHLCNDLSKVLGSLSYHRLYKGNLRQSAWPGISTREFACLSLADSILKKFEDKKSAMADEAALTKFIEANTHCGKFAAIDETLCSDLQSIAIGETKSILHDFWFDNGDYWLNLDEIVEGMAVGPGSSIGASGESFYHKIASSPLTCTRSSLFTLFKRESSRTPLTSATENIRSEVFGESVLVTGSRLAYVPKTSEISRTTCTEPLLNMMFQQGIARQFTAALRRKFGINLSNQPAKNQELCRIGSISGAFGTIDLSSASDTISLGLIKQLLPPYVIGWLMETRSPSVTLPGGSVVPLHMVSSMGNAFTFPLQTILFSSIVLGCYAALDIKVAYPRGDGIGNFGVFGDDIIVDRKAYDLVVNLLGRFGFFVNTDKSFNSGSFRESCGVDYFDGTNVRGIYCRTLKHLQDMYSLINRLNVWSANHAVPLPSTIGFLFRETGKKFIPVPVWESDTAGIKVPLNMLTDCKLKTVNFGSIVYQRYEPRSKALSLLAIQQRPLHYRRQKLINNVDGMYLAVLGGYARNGKLVLRQQLVHYRLRKSIAPTWDIEFPTYQCPQSVVMVSDFTKGCRLAFTSPGGWHRWKTTYVRINLLG